jgi:hypothetical protein
MLVILMLFVVILSVIMMSHAFYCYSHMMCAVILSVIVLVVVAPFEQMSTNIFQLKIHYTWHFGGKNVSQKKKKNRLIPLPLVIFDSA